MKTSYLYLMTLAAALNQAVLAAPVTNQPPPRLTVELRDGSRIVGESGSDHWMFSSALFGKVKMPVQEIWTAEFVSSNVVKLKAVNGDSLNFETFNLGLNLKTGFGKVELATESIRRISVTTGGTYLPQRDGLIGYWAGNGNAEDIVGRHSGELIGDTDFVPGLRGQAFRFNSPGSFVKIPKSADLNPTGQFTIEFWMNASADNRMDGFQGLVTSDFFGVEISNGFGGGRMGVNCYVTTMVPGGWYGSKMGQGLSGMRSTYSRDAIFSDSNGGATIVAAGQWHHIVSTYDGNYLRLFINGQPVGNPVSQSGVVKPMTAEGFMAIGSEDGRANYPNCLGQRYFKGFISDVAIYDRALSIKEIQEDFSAGDRTK